MYVSGVYDDFYSVHIPVSYNERSEGLAGYDNADGCFGQTS